MVLASVAHDRPAMLPSSLDDFEVDYVAEGGVRRRVPLADAWAVRFEAAAPARRFNVRKGQRHLPGRWWSATDGGHVGFESWLERDLIRTLRRVITLSN